MKRGSVHAALGLALLAAVSVVQGANSAGRPSCLVLNQDAGQKSRSLQDAIDAAASADTLVVKGTCVGSSAIDKNLTLRGVTNKPFGIATLDGTGFGGTVLTINGGTVAIRNLTITNGLERGIDVFPSSQLTVVDSVVSDNGGIGILNIAASLTLSKSSVADNTGVGIRNAAGGEVTLAESTVTGNAGIGIQNGASEASEGGLVTLTDSTVSDNTAGGIFSATATTLTRSIVSGNSASGGGGGGIYVYAGVLTLTSSTVSGNTAANGGGIFNVGSIFSDGQVTLTNSTVSGNTATNSGGGIFNAAEGPFNNAALVTLTDSTVSGNTAANGGGIFNNGMATLIGSNAFLNNVPENCVGVSGC